MQNVTESDDSIKTYDLLGYLKPQAERIARKQYNNEQTPQLIEAENSKRCFEGVKRGGVL